VWHEKIMQYAEESDGSVKISEILSRLGMDVAKQDQTAANRVARSLKSGGWQRYRERIGKTLKWRYRRRKDEK
jgi:hypothetical protein